MISSMKPIKGRKVPMPTAKQQGNAKGMKTKTFMPVSQDMKKSHPDNKSI